MNFHILEVAIKGPVVQTVHKVGEHLHIGIVALNSHSFTLDSINKVEIGMYQS